MANKNTLRIRRFLAKDRKRGIAINSENGGRWKGGRVDNQEKIVGTIRELSKRLYGR